MRTNQVTLSKISQLKELLKTTTDHSDIWKRINQPGNLSLILDNFEAFLPSLAYGHQFNSLFPSKDILKDLELFSIYSIISLHKSGLFSVLLRKFMLSGANLDALFTTTFTYLGTRAKPFEMAFIISAPDVCEGITNAFKSLPFLKISVQEALTECSNLNLIFNSPPPNLKIDEISPKGSLLRSTLNTLPKPPFPIVSLLNSLPTSYHSRLLRLFYTTDPSTLPTLYDASKKWGSFKPFIAQFIAVKCGLAPLSKADEDSFLECMQTYFSLSSTCRALHFTMTTKTNEIPVEADLVIYYLAMNKYQNSDFTKRMSQICPLIRTYTKPHNLLNFCESFLTQHAQNSITSAKKRSYDELENTSSEEPANKRAKIYHGK